MFKQIYLFALRLFLIIFPAIAIVFITACAVAGFISRWYLIIPAVALTVFIIWYNIRQKREYNLFVYTEKESSVDKREEKSEN